MTKIAFARAALAAAALSLAGAAAQAGVLVDGYSPGAGAGGLGFIDGASLAPTGTTFALPDEPQGLVYGAGSLFVSVSDGPSNQILRYNLAGDQIGGMTLPPFEFGPLAYGADTVFAGYEGFSTNGVLLLGLDLTIGPAISLPEAPSGLAFGDGDLFVSYGSVLARYDPGGALLASHDFGADIDLGPLAFGNGQLFMAYGPAVGGSFSDGFAALDPADFLSIGLNIPTFSPINGLAFGDGGLFASFDDRLVRYDAGGAQVASLSTGGLHNGPLAFIPQPGRGEDPRGAVPEPSAWALMILGFGAAGAVLRARRRMLAHAIA